MFRVMVWLFLINGLLVCQDELLINPQDTDSSIDRWLEPHLVINKNTPVNKILFLFLPGTNAVPSDTKLILKLADSLGYYSIGLSYPDEWDINILCGNSEDSLAYENTRFEITYGVDLNDYINVNWNNSIEGRLISLLIYLNAHYPDNGWNKFLNGDGLPEWSKMIIAGHSQGGGNAALIAKYNKIERLVLFSSPKDYSTYYSTPAFWLSEPFVTPVSDIYTFAHRQDFINTYYKIWRELGLYNYGDPANADAQHFPFNHSHMLTTNIFPGPDEDYTGSVVMDKSTPKDSSGNPLFKEEWMYICFNQNATEIAEQNNIASRFYLYPNYPNPFNVSTRIQFIVPKDDYITLDVFNSVGEKVATIASAYFISGNYKFNWDAHEMSSGVYFVKLNNSQTNMVQKVMLLK